MKSRIFRAEDIGIRQKGKNPLKQLIFFQTQHKMGSSSLISLLMFNRKILLCTVQEKVRIATLPHLPQALKYLALIKIWKTNKNKPSKLRPQANAEGIRKMPFPHACSTQLLTVQLSISDRQK
ncbi:hypothetical protein FGO68_gene10398 [Halteria grandinella]|uniref:Uncharacterized protein n=1 Tax=Halteria grandinella TaxID=5974 RepID=A0A8J8T952_HALGN|nr:hypothetical protein FGO68_gene10398 [Halteria grandinella]